MGVEWINLELVVDGRISKGIDEDFRDIFSVERLFVTRERCFWFRGGQFEQRSEGSFGSGDAN
jgi:hypothetical protein